MTLGPQNANFSTMEFRAELALLLIYILVVYEEYIIKASNFNIRKNSRARGDPWVFGGHFLHPLKITLRINGPVSFFMGPSGGHPECTCHIPLPGGH